MTAPIGFERLAPPNAQPLRFAALCPPEPAFKRVALRQHGLLQLNAMLGAYEDWDEDAILDRGDKLLGHALRVRPRPLPAL